MLAVKIAVEKCAGSLGLESAHNVGQHHFVSKVARPRGSRWIMRRVECKRVTMLRAVRGVAVDKHVRVPFVDKPHQGPNFRSFQFYEVAIEIEALSVFTTSHDVG